MKIAVSAIGPSMNDLVKTRSGRASFFPDSRYRYKGSEKEKNNTGVIDADYASIDDGH